MSRSGYSDECDDEWEAVRWRGAVTAALRGQRGQAFLREMLAALDALPAPRLIREELVTTEGCCAMGAVALRRGTDVSDVDPYDTDTIADTFGIAEAMVSQIAYVNDDDFNYAGDETPERRFARVRAWVLRHIVVTPGELAETETGERDG
jgi:hypothetical protein